MRAMVRVSGPMHGAGLPWRVYDIVYVLSTHVRSSLSSRLLPLRANLKTKIALLVV